MEICFLKYLFQLIMAIKPVGYFDERSYRILFPFVFTLFYNILIFISLKWQGYNAVTQTFALKYVKYKYLIDCNII